jgi:hypothetical protein
VKKPPEPTASEAGYRHPDYVIELARNPQLNQRNQDRQASLTDILQAGSAKEPEADPEPRLAEREAEP